MPVVIRFRSPDPRQRASLTLSDAAAATAHVAAALADGAHWTLDEDGEDPATVAFVAAAIAAGHALTLYDQASLGTIETIEVGLAA